VPPFIDYNCWFNKSGSKIIQYKSIEYTKANFHRWKEEHRNDDIRDPGIDFTGPDFSGLVLMNNTP
jgi:hypothetical protein